MLNDMEEQPNADQPQSSSKALIFDTFTKLRKWREEQVEQFRKMQLRENEKLLLKSQESQRLFQQLLEKTGENAVEMSEKASPEKVVSEFNHSSSESSITGHLLNCFSDASSCTSFNEGNNIFKDVISPTHLVGKVQNLIASSHASHSKEQEICSSNLSAKKPCRPFLKKGSGLARYMPKAGKKDCTKTISKDESPNIDLTVSKIQKSYPCAQKTLKLKPAIRSNPIQNEKSKHLQFDDQVLETVLEVPVNQENQLEENGVDLNEKNADYETKDSHDCDFTNSEDKNLVTEKNISTDSLNLEHKELAEFELLENCAQNSSFNSDSSFVQRVIHGETQKCSLPSSSPSNLNFIDNNSLQSSQMKNFKENYNATEETGLTNCLSEVQTRKQQLQKMISDINPRIVSLQKEIDSKKDIFEDEDSDLSERCSTPLLNSEPDDKMLENQLENCNKNDLSFESVKETHKNIVMHSKDCPVFTPAIDTPAESETEVKQNNLEQERNINEERIIESLDKSPTSVPLKLKEKFLELEKEISIYQELNAKLSQICKERDNIVRKLTKEREEFQKQKEEEKQKLQLELEENQRQIKRQKETFLRYQKLRQDNPLKKEREAISMLRQEVTVLQEELSRLKIKYNNDTKKLKNQLIIVEKDRDQFKMENIRLDDQCKDLLAALKDINKRWKQSVASKRFHNCIVCDSSEKALEHEEDHKNVKLQNEDQYDKVAEELKVKKSVMKCNDLNSQLSGTKLRVRFDLPEYQSKVQSENSDSENDHDNGFEVNMNDQANEVRIDINDHLDNDAQNNVNIHGADDAICNSDDKSVENSQPYREIDHGEKIERIYDSGEREIIYSSGTRKLFNPAKNVLRFSFYNGDSKEVYPDGKEIYKYANGAVETSFPDGFEVTEFPNGQIQKLYPDGKRKVKFADGTIHTIHSDGSEKIFTSEGTTIFLDVDGTETIQYSNGQREIRTKDCKTRHYLDGSIKIVHKSGRQEITYPNGRVKIKDKEGKIILDTKHQDQKTKV